MQESLGAPEATNTQDHHPLGLAIDEVDQEFLYDMAQTPDTRQSRASSSPVWQQVNWSLTETDSSSAGSSSCASGLGSLPLTIQEGSADETPLSPPRFAPRARRRHYTTHEDVSDISDEDDDGDELSFSRRRSKPRRQYYWTPFRGLTLLFFLTAYTIFGIPDDDLDLAVPTGMEVPIQAVAPIVEMNATTSTATSSLLRAPQPNLPALLQIQDNHRLQYAVKQPRGLTFKQQAEMERFYHQPALHSSLTIGRFYYAVALLGVVLWAVRVQHSHLRVWK